MKNHPVNVPYAYRIPPKLLFTEFHLYVIFTSCLEKSVVFRQSRQTATSIHHIFHSISLFSSAAEPQWKNRRPRLSFHIRQTDQIVSIALHIILKTEIFSFLILEK